MDFRLDAPTVQHGALGGRRLLLAGTKDRFLTLSCHLSHFNQSKAHMLYHTEVVLALGLSYQYQTQYHYTVTWTDIHTGHDANANSLIVISELALQHHKFYKPLLKIHTCIYLLQIAICLQPGGITLFEQKL